MREQSLQFTFKFFIENAVSVAIVEPGSKSDTIGSGVRSTSFEEKEIQFSCIELNNTLVVGRLLSVPLSAKHTSVRRSDEMCVRKLTIISAIFAVSFVLAFRSIRICSRKIVMLSEYRRRDCDGGWGDAQSHGKSVFNEP